MGLGGYCDSDSVPTSCRDGPWKVRADEAVLPDRSGQPRRPTERERGPEQQLFIDERVVPSASGQSSACLAGERGQWEPPPTAACAGPSPSSSAPSPLPAKPSWGQRAKEGKAREHSWARAVSRAPRGRSRPSPGEPHSEHPHSLQIISLAPLPNTRLIRTTCPRRLTRLLA